MIHRVRSHATFAALVRVRPRRDGPVWVRRIDSDGARRPEVAYAIGRTSGNAVIRNRLRRQLRAIVHEHHEYLRPGSAYLVGVTKVGKDASFQELSDSYVRCLGADRD
ncbi:MAG: ribonuclease P protein component [Acidimicrobiia bacterium]